MVFPKEKKGDVDPRFMSSARAQKVYNTSERTLQRRVNAKLLTKHKKKGRVYYLIAELDACFNTPPQAI